MPSPTTPILDDFNRADENPLSGAGNWGGFWPQPGSPADLKLVSQRVEGISTSKESNSFWAATTFNEDQECYATVPTLPTGIPPHQWPGVYCRIRGPAGSFKVYGWEVKWDRLTLLKVIGTTVTVLQEQMLGGGDSLPHLHVGGPTGVAFLPGMAIWLHCQGSTISGYIGELGGDYTLITQATDTSVAGAGAVGMQIFVVGPTLDNFGGGNL